MQSPLMVLPSLRADTLIVAVPIRPPPAVVPVVDVGKTYSFVAVAVGPGSHEPSPYASVHALIVATPGKTAPSNVKLHCPSTLVAHQPPPVVAPETEKRIA